MSKFVLPLFLEVAYSNLNTLPNLNLNIGYDAVTAELVQTITLCICGHISKL